MHDKAFFSRIFSAVVFTQFGYAYSKSFACQLNFNWHAKDRVLKALIFVFPLQN